MSLQDEKKAIDKLNEEMDATIKSWINKIKKIVTEVDEIDGIYEKDKIAGRLLFILSSHCLMNAIHKIIDPSKFFETVDAACKFIKDQMASQNRQ